MDLAGMTDAELVDLVVDVEAEQDRRLTLTEAPGRAAAALAAASKAAGEYLTAAGRNQGEPWVQPTAAHDAYPKGWQVEYEGHLWESLMAANPYAPGVSGWRVVTAEGEAPGAWLRPTGAHDAYWLDDLVTWEGQTYRSTLDANVWSPAEHGWELVVETTLPEPEQPPTDPEDPVAPAWVQPVGGHDAYQVDDLVTHNGATWRATVGQNVWEPGVYGWVQLL